MFLEYWGFLAYWWGSHNIDGMTTIVQYSTEYSLDYSIVREPGAQNWAIGTKRGH